MRKSMSLLVLGLVGCGRAGDSGDARMERVRQDLSVLAHDSMAGRRTGTAGARAAGVYIAGQLAAAGAQPAGDSGFFQPVPFVRGPDGRMRLPESWAAFSDRSPDGRLIDINVVAMLRGTDAELSGEAVIVGAHHDHVGIGRPVDGDSIYNGADDDASGVVAAIEIARALAADPPARTVVFLVTTGEEQGLLGTRWYAANPVVPLANTMANLQIEMIGRPDTAVGGPGMAWLTGHELSTMGEIFETAGLSIRPDPRPEQGFFRRSDNYVFAQRGIPAHTLSSFTLHADYHRPSDEIERIDFTHLVSVIETAVDAVKLLSTGAAPRWRAGMRPPSP